MDWRTYFATRSAATVPPANTDCIPIHQGEEICRMEWPDVVAELKSGRKNYIINGNFDIWQRGILLAASASNRYLADRFFTVGAGSTVAPSQQVFALGQVAVPNEPSFFHRTVVASAAGVNNYAYQSQRIESVRSLAGKTVMLTFWAKADANKNIAVEFIQHFGTGGAPSATITGIGVVACALTGLWQKTSITVEIPSIAGKTIGSNGDDYLAIQWWFDAGSASDARTAALGQQSGTFDIAQVQLEEGSEATAFEYRQIAEELGLCQRYFCKTFNQNVPPADSVALGTTGALVTRISGSDEPIVNWRFPVTMRATPTITLYNPYLNGTPGQWRNGSDNISSANATTGSKGEMGCAIGNGTVALAGTSWYIAATAAAEL